MELAGFVRITALASVSLVVAGLGLRSLPGEVTQLFHRPALLVRSVLAMNVVMPLAIIVLVSLFELRPAVKMALVALAISPVPPFLPSKQLRIGASRAYLYSLFLTTTLLSVVLVPLTMTFIAARVAGGRHVGPLQVLSIVTLTTLLPLCAGMSIRKQLPALASRLLPRVEQLGNALLILALVLMLIWQWADMRALIGDGTLLATVVFTLLGLLVGHWLGGPVSGDRSVLALAVASRHPAVALAVAQVSFPNETLVPAAVVLALVVGLIASTPYVMWRRRIHASENGR